jgi:hypothetical protein
MRSGTAAISPSGSLQKVFGWSSLASVDDSDVLTTAPLAIGAMQDPSVTRYFDGRGLMTQSDELEATLSRLLLQSQSIEPKNRLTLADVRRSTAEFLAALADEFARFPDEREGEHWDLVMSDTNPTAPASFVFIMVGPEKAQFEAGCDYPWGIRNYCDHDSSADPHETLSGLRLRFTMVREGIDVPLLLLSRWASSETSHPERG